jgi:2-methylcitrate dehydratase PrpD
LGTEVAARLNLSESAYNGFDPTGVCGIFAATAVASKILHLNSREILNALGLAFNRSGGSLQSNIDGSLAVRLIQGWVSQSGIMCARMARIGATGPTDFLEGVYGYFHLYARDTFEPEVIAGGLGESFELQRLVFKKYPSCGGTLGSTDAILRLIEEHRFAPEDVDRIHIKLTPYVYKLCGHQFRVGDNPRVNAQFSIQYCVANALLRNSSKLRHFEESYVKDHKVMGLVRRIHVAADPALEKRGHTAMDMKILTAGGDVYRKSIDVAPGFPENPLTQKENEERFWDCIDFAQKPLPKEKVKKITSLVARLEELEDVRILIPLFLASN